MGLESSKIGSQFLFTLSVFTKLRLIFVSRTPQYSGSSRNIKNTLVDTISMRSIQVKCRNVQMFIFINFTEFYSYNFNGALFSFVLEKGSR